MKTSTLLVATLAAVAATASAQSVGAPPMTGCAGQAVYERCFADVQITRDACVPGDQAKYYDCLCKTAGQFKLCFDQCRDAPDYAARVAIYSGEEGAYCRAGAQFSSASATSTTSSRAASATGSSSASASAAAPTGSSSTSGASSASATSGSSAAKPTGSAISSGNSLAGSVAAAAVAVVGGVLAL
ncbi:hypothetical protein H9P43_006293 [Blastocladiella emersonii ATCC 22665]|nr:hypothetical protein H9P43_006293 [Blastocladiella emersonii ATCC 22665]